MGGRGVKGDEHQVPKRLGKARVGKLIRPNDEEGGKHTGPRSNRKRVCRSKFPRKKIKKRKKGGGRVLDS